MKPLQQAVDGHSFLFSFSFWIYIDTTTPPSIQEFLINGRKLRIYPPFRSGSVDFLPAPHLAFNAVPFLPAKEDYQYFRAAPPALAVYPNLGKDEHGKTSAKAYGPPYTGDTSQLPKDSLRIDILDTQPDYKTIVDEVTTRFLRLLRWRTGQWWIGQSTLSRYGTMEFPISQEGTPIRVSNATPGPSTQITTVHGDEKQLNDSLWQQAIADLQTGIDVPVYDLLILDAISNASFGRDYRKAILDADAACEHLKEITFERLWCLKNPGKVYTEKVRKDLLRNWNLPCHLDIKFFNHFRRSYKKEHLTEWETIKNLWNARNNVAHGGPNEYGNPPVKVDRQIAVDFIKAAQHCVAWLKSL